MTQLPVPSEEQIRACLRRGEVSFPPLAFAWSDALQGEDIDGLLRGSWQGGTVEFAAECKRALSPKTIVQAAETIIQPAQRAKLRPLVVVPFLDEAALNTLEAMAVSGIDLCGNGTVVVPGTWYLRRTGGPNLFRSESTIKNVYRNTSSVVARLFLVRREFGSVQDALDELTRRGGGVTLATVSKVCKELEEDLIIERNRGAVTTLRLLQPDKLIERLVANYAPPTVCQRITGKLRGIEPAGFRARLKGWAAETGNKVALSGGSSVPAYAVMARSGIEEFYCTDLADALRALGDRFQQTERFATVGLLEVANDEVYFDRRDDLSASPVQTLLELMSGDKRDQETAEQVRSVVMSGVPTAAEK